MMGRAPGDDVKKHLAAIRPVISTGLEEDRVDILDAGSRVDKDEKEGGDSHDHNLAGFSYTENEHHERKIAILGSA